MRRQAQLQPTGIVRNRVNVVRTVNDLRQFMESFETGLRCNRRHHDWLMHCMMSQQAPARSYVYCAHVRSSGMTCRCIVVDAAMPSSQQTCAANSICKPPDDTFSKQLVDDIKKIHQTQVGSIAIHLSVQSLSMLAW
jgi:hypothetical protein